MSAGPDPAPQGGRPGAAQVRREPPGGPGAPGDRRPGGTAGTAPGATAADVDDAQASSDAEVILDGAPEPVAGGVDAEVAAIATQRDEYLAALQLLQADFENYRKRVQRQQVEQSARAALDLVGKLLPVLDALDLAETHLGAAEGDAVSEEGKALSQARALLIDALAKEGLERVAAAEVPFDPVVHDAVAHAPGDESGETVVDDVLRAGYRWQGQVLRPAMVRVRG